MPYTALEPEQRRRLILAALSGESPSKLATEYGVSRSHVYKLKEEAIEQADEQVEFWVAVRRLAKEEDE
jgi:DNA invertase Pin-like site-specific DNA recombinase